MLRRWYRWIIRPFAEPIVAMGLVVAISVPVFLVVTAAAWSAAGADQAARRLAEETPLDTAGIDLGIEVAFEGADPRRAGSFDRADREVRTAVGAIGDLGAVTRTLYTLPALGITGLDDPLGIPVRLFARPGATAAVEIERQSEVTDGGVWISSWLADKSGLDIGDDFRLEVGAMVDEPFNDVVPGGGAASSLTVVGVYRELWSPERTEPLGYWASVPPELLPRYLAPFDEPSFELVLLEEATLVASPLTGFARWVAPAERLPDTLDELRRLDRRYEGLEAALLRRTPLGEAVGAIAADPGRRPRVTTTLGAITDDAERASDRVDSPVRTVRTLGLVVGFATTLGVGAFVVDRRRTEFRLLAAEGKRWEQLTSMVAAQLVLPAVFGVVIGVAAALCTASVIGPLGGLHVRVVPWRACLAVTAVHVALSAAIAGLMGTRTVEATGRHRSRAALVPTIAVTLLSMVVWLWIEVDRAAPTPGRVDLPVVSLPVMMALLASIAVTGLLALASRSALRWRTPRSPVVLLCARRLGMISVGRVGVLVALSVGFGLVTYAVVLSDAVEDSLATKSLTVVGGITRFDLAGVIPDDLPLPRHTALVASQDTRSSPDDGRLRVVAVDPRDLGDGISWPSSYGISAEDAASLLGGDSATSLPVIAVDGDAVPTEGAFGAGRTFPYRVVARIAALPLAGEFGSTILVSAPALDGFGASPPPTSRFRRHLVSSLSQGRLDAAVGTSALTVRERHSVDVIEQSVDAIAVRVAFDYVRVVGAVAAITAFAALVMQLAASRRERALAGVMLGALGVPPRRSAWITMVEVTVRVVATLVVAAIVATTAVMHSARLFDPLARVPPTPSVDVPWGGILLAGAAACVVVAASTWLGEVRTARRSPAEVVRDVAS